MTAVQAVLFLVAVILLVVAAFPTGSRVSLALLGVTISSGRSRDISTAPPPRPFG